MTTGLQDGPRPLAEAGRIGGPCPREAVVVTPETYGPGSDPDAEPLPRVLAARAARRRRPPPTAAVTGPDG